MRRLLACTLALSACFEEAPGAEDGTEGGDSSSGETGSESSSGESGSDGSSSTGDPPPELDCPGPFCECTTADDCKRPCIDQCPYTRIDGMPGGSASCGDYEDGVCSEAAKSACDAGTCTLHLDATGTLCDDWHPAAVYTSVTDSMHPLANGGGILESCVIPCADADDCRAAGMTTAACVIVGTLSPTPICVWGS